MDRAIVHTLPYAILPLTDDNTEKKFNVSNQVEGNIYVARNHEAGSQDDMAMFVSVILKGYEFDQKKISSTPVLRRW